MAEAALKGKGRPTLPLSTRQVIAGMADSGMGGKAISAALAERGIWVSPKTVRKYLPASNIPVSNIPAREGHDSTHQPGNPAKVVRKPSKGPAPSPPTPGQYYAPFKPPFVRKRTEYAGLCMFCGFTQHHDGKAYSYKGYAYRCCGGKGCHNQAQAGIDREMGAKVG